MDNEKGLLIVLSGPSGVGKVLLENEASKIQVHHRKILFQ